MCMALEIVAKVSVCNAPTGLHAILESSMAQLQAPISVSATALSPAAKKLRQIINSKLPVPHEEEAIKDIVSMVAPKSAVI